MKERHAVNGKTFLYYFGLLLVVLALLLTALVAVSPDSDASRSGLTPARPKMAKVFTACAEEDDVNCMWTDPVHPGEQFGHPYIVRVMPGTARQTCVIHVYARDSRLDYCS